MACLGHEREQAAERAETGGGRGVGLLVGGQAASTVGDAWYAVALPCYVLTGHCVAAALVRVCNRSAGYPLRSAAQNW
jgi:hypothetical protein